MKDLRKAFCSTQKVFESIGLFASELELVRELVLLIFAEY